MTTDPRFNLALKYYYAGLNSEAWSALEELAKLQDASAEVAKLAATLKFEAHAFSDAIYFCDRFLESTPNDVPTLLLKANALDQLGRPRESIDAYHRVIAIEPTSALAHNNLGVVHLGQGRFAAAAKSFEASLALEPKNTAALVNLGVTHIERGHVAAGLDYFSKAYELSPTNLDLINNRLFSMHNVATDPCELFDAHTAWSKGVAHSSRRLTTDAQPNRKLRIGYLSPDFRYHSVGFFVEALLTCHDRAAFDVTCYSNLALPDETTLRFKALADRWRDIKGVSTGDAVAQIDTDQIDILVDLAGHTMGNRLDVFAARAAPVQLTAIGYPGTTGLSVFDGRFGDVVADPPENDPYSSEPVLRVTGGMHCYTPPPTSPGVSPLPFLSTAHITFGSFNKLAKISDATIAMWSAVLSAVPRSKLLIKTKPLTEEETRTELAARFKRAGIGAERLDLRGWSPNDQDHFAVYNHVDIALDTSPYNGTTTTCEALWMGVPVITLAGRTHASRVGASLLTSIALTELIAQTPEQFVHCAVRLAKHLDQLGRLRLTLRERVANSRLCDAKAYTQVVESTYRDVWIKRCSR